MHPNSTLPQHCTRNFIIAVTNIALATPHCSNKIPHMMDDGAVKTFLESSKIKKSSL